MDDYEEMFGMTDKQSDTLMVLARLDELCDVYDVITDAITSGDDLSADDMRGATIMLERLREYIKERKKVLKSYLA